MVPPAQSMDPDIRLNIRQIQLEGQQLNKVCGLLYCFRLIFLILETGLWIR